MGIVESIKFLFLDTGAAWVLWLLGTLSVASVAIAFERWWLFRTHDTDLHQLSTELHAWLQSGNLQLAIEKLQSSSALAARVAAAGLKLADRGGSCADKAMTSRVALEQETLERRLTYLGTLGNNAPFIGLFGTVVGVIQAFEVLGAESVTPGSGSAMASEALMSSISEALVATAVGILVALPAVGSYNFLQRKLTSLLSGAEVTSNLVLAYLANETKTRAHLCSNGFEQDPNRCQETEEHLVVLDPTERTKDLRAPELTSLCQEQQGGLPAN